jgi:excisionase family DNA binding protein
VAAAANRVLRRPTSGRTPKFIRGRPVGVTRTTALADLPVVLTPRECAVHGSCSASTIYTLVKTGKLTVVRYGREVRITRESWQRFLSGDTGGVA